MGCLNTVKTKRKSWVLSSADVTAFACPEACAIRPLSVNVADIAFVTPSIVYNLSTTVQWCRYCIRQQHNQGAFLLFLSKQEQDKANNCRPNLSKTAFSPLERQQLYLNMPRLTRIYYLVRFSVQHSTLHP